MSLDNAEVTGWLDDHGCVPNGWNWVCPQVFVEFGIDPDLTVRAVTLLAPAPRTAGYQGALPEGISFSDGPDTLARKLGSPRTGRAAPGSSLFWRYRDGRQLIVNFRQISPLQIGHVQVAAP
jgi:hypothetical protein